MSEMAKPVWCWHPWHNTLLARCCLEWRRQEIRVEKPKREIPLRMKLLQRANLRTLTRWERIELYNIGQIMGRFADLHPAYRTLAKKLTVLHRQQCPRCPWGRGKVGLYRGETCIFTRMKKNGEWY